MPGEKGEKDMGWREEPVAHNGNQLVGVKRKKYKEIQ
jgi:hypothetical protein